jgi:2-polyprenyl-6-methoxyphenol hydroxylase-like FAD-dependent oxidoreductase
VSAAHLSRSRRGTFVIDHENERHGPHDLIVVADGARSALRNDPGVSKTVAEYPWGALWYVAEDRDKRFHTELYQVVDGNQRMLGLLPTGVGPSANAKTPLVSIFWSIRGDRVAAWRATGIDAWKEEVLALVPHADTLLASIARHDDLLFATYHDVVMSRWNTHDVVYLGDAAHAMSPQLGQGCNLALYDAYTLAACIDEHHEVPAALSAYSAARTDHLRIYQLATRWLTPFFQSDAAILGWIRDVGMGSASRLPFVARAMSASMSGILTGIFSRLDLPRRR